MVKKSTDFQILERGSLTLIDGIKVGHWCDVTAATGCTVVLCPPDGCVASADVRGGAPGTRETDLLAPAATIERINALVLSGGSALGLDAATGVTRWLLEQGIGFLTPHATIPIVPAAVIYDLGIGRSDIYPDALAGYTAVSGATKSEVGSGRIGAGTGATCGKYLGFESAERGGLGNAAAVVGGAKVSVLVVANPVGDIHDPESGKVAAGARNSDGSRPNSQTMPNLFAGTNTTLVAVATDALLSKADCNVLAKSAHAGIARVTRPSHTPLDGDTAFALTTATGPVVSLMALSIVVQELVARAILAAVQASNSD